MINVMPPHPTPPPLLLFLFYCILKQQLGAAEAPPLFALRPFPSHLDLYLDEIFTLVGGVVLGGGSLLAFLLIGRAARSLNDFFFFSFFPSRTFL